RLIEDALPPIPIGDETSRVLEEFRRARFAELTRLDTVPEAEILQERRHYLAATFRPKALQKSSGAVWKQRARGWLRRTVEGRRGYEQAYEGVLEEAGSLQRAIDVRLGQLGVGIERCRTDELIGLLHELLNPSGSRAVDVRTIPDSSRLHRDLPPAIVKALPWLSSGSPVWTLLDDDLAVRREFLRLGEEYVTVLSLKSLPDRTEPGLLTSLLHLARDKYQVS